MLNGTRRILVIEDDQDTAAQAVDWLQRSGYEVDLARDGGEALSRAQAPIYVVMTVDRLLPGLDGIEIIQRLRKGGVSTPALIISALGEVDERIRGLRAGGDDYLVKPFAWGEMVARVDALARRSGTVVGDTLLRAGDLEMDLLSRKARRGMREIELLPREFKLLEYLLRNAGRVVPRTMLLQHVWNFHVDAMTNVVDVYVGRLRRKVDREDEYPLIHTVRGIGFCLRAPG